MDGKDSVSLWLPGHQRFSFCTVYVGRGVGNGRASAVKAYHGDFMLWNELDQMLLHTVCLSNELQPKGHKPLCPSHRSTR